MANLIIKSSADNLVLQGSDASPAITVGATGTTTFAENATLSGTANNLGTSTAGTLSSGVTFPTGHVLQVLIDNDATEQTLSSDTYTATDLSIAITPSATSSKILCQWSMHAVLDDTEGYGTQLYSSDDGAIYTSTTAYDLYAGEGDTGMGYLRLRSWFAYIDSPSTVSTVTYTIKVASYASRAITFNDGNNQTQLILMEIAG